MRFTHILLCTACISLVACASKSFTPSDKHIQQSSVAPATAGDIPQPSKRPTILPPPKPATKIETYSVVVTNVSAREILFALARDAKINIDIGPGIEGVVTLNAIDQTLPQILDRIAKQVDMRYSMDNGNLFVEADKPYLKTYKIDFINMSRTVSSKIFTSSQIGGATATTAGGNTASTAISSDTKNDLMNSLVDNVKAILADEDRIRYTERIERRNELAASARGTGSASENSSNPSTSNTNSGKGQSGKSGDGVSGKGNEDVTGQSSTVQQTAKYEPAVNVNANKETGVLLVRATGRQHAKIQEFIDKVMNTARRQVLIEATIAEVTLSDNYQQGIDWSALAAGAKGFSLTQAGTVGLPTSTNTPKMMVLKYVNPTSKFGDLSSSVSLLDSFGDVKVLSSPKLSVMNNQTATLKVVDNKVYFTITVTPGNTNGTFITQPVYTTTAVPVAVGFTMNVTPEINDADYVTINVRPTITRIIGYVNDPNPSLAYPCGTSATCSVTPIVNKVPEIRTREMESIIRISSGQVAVLGGLMQDEINNLTDSVPLLGEIPIAGNLFKSRNDTKTKTELVIFLRPVVIKDASLEGDFSTYRNNLPDANYLKPENEKPKP
jgi:general secretion pathway protein D